MQQWAESVLADAASLSKDYIQAGLVQSIWKDYIEKGNWSSLIWYILMFEQWLLHENGK